MKTFLKINEHPELERLVEQKKRSEDVLVFKCMKKEEELNQLRKQLQDIGENFWPKVHDYIAEKNIDPGTSVYWLDEKQNELQEGEPHEMALRAIIAIQEGPGEAFKELEKQAKEAAGQEVH